MHNIRKNQINLKYWKIADEIKRRLFNLIRNSFKEKPIIDASISFEKSENFIQRRIREVHRLILEEWKNIKREYQNNPHFNEKRLSGYLYEALFYLSSLELMSRWFRNDIYWMGCNLENKMEAPAHLEILPLYDIIPPITYKPSNNEKAKVPQLKGDFIAFYVEGPSGQRKVTPIALIEVKKSLSSYRKRDGKWVAIAALRHGLVAQVAYPKTQLDKLYSLENWEIKTVCPSCGKLMDKIYRTCPFCKKEAYLFTRENWEEL